MEEMMEGMGMGMEELREVVSNQSAWRMLTMTVLGLNESMAPDDKVTIGI